MDDGLIKTNNGCVSVSGSHRCRTSLIATVSDILRKQGYTQECIAEVDGVLKGLDTYQEVVDTAIAVADSVGLPISMC